MRRGEGEDFGGIVGGGDGDGDGFGEVVAEELAVAGDADGGGEPLGTGADIQIDVGGVGILDKAAVAAGVAGADEGVTAEA